MTEEISKAFESNPIDEIYFYTIGKHFYNRHGQKIELERQLLSKYIYLAEISQRDFLLEGSEWKELKKNAK